MRTCSLEDHVKDLVAEDAVLVEASCGSFYWADRVEATGATCFVLDTRNLAKALWVFLVTGEFGIPTVYKPSEPKDRLTSEIMAARGDRDVTAGMQIDRAIADSDGRWLRAVQFSDRETALHPPSRTSRR